MTETDSSHGPSFDETLEATQGSLSSGASSRASGGTRPGASVSHLDLERGASLGRYIVIERLGAGGMGVVYKAYDPQLDRSVAVKLVRTEDFGTAGSTGAARLLREAQAMARLSHPNVVPVFDVGTIDDEVYVAMEFICGRTLSAAIEGASRTQVMDWFVAAGRGVAAAHAAGLVHRDFKPDNAIVGDDGRVRVLDFGLARARGPGSASANAGLDDTATSEGRGASDAPILAAGSLDSALTVAGAVIGTPAYMSPEQHAGVDAGPPSDQFSFAVALYEALAGHRPFEGDSLAALAFSVMKGKPKPIEVERNVPAHVDSALRRALAPDPADRFASVDELLAELERDPAARRRRWAWAAGATVAVAGLGGLGGLGLGRAGDADTIIVAADPCAEAGAASEEVLAGATERAAVDALPERARPAFDEALRRFETDWRRHRVEACEATRTRGEQSQALMDRRMACLDRRLDDVGSLLQLVSADASVHDEALSAVEALGDPARLVACADVASLREREAPPVDPRLVERISTAEHELSQIRALGHTGKVGDALERATPLIEEARAIAWAPLEAEVAIERGALHSMKGDGPGAETALTEAFRAALAAHDDATAIDAASRLTYVIGHTRHETERGLEWAEHTRALLRRHPIAHEEAGLEQSIAAVLVTAGRYDDGIEAHRKAIAMFEELQGPTGVDVAIGLNNMGGAHFAKGNPEDALPLHERALEIFEAVRVEGHPDLATTLSFLGNARGGMGEFAAAQRDFERAHEMAVAAFGETNRTSAIALDNAARMIRKQGDVAAAIAIHERALKIWIELLGENHADVGISRLNVGYAWVAAEDHEQALEAFTAALASFESSVGGEHPFIMYACNSVGTSLVELGRPREAYACLERVLGMDDSQVDPTLTAETRFVLARARWEAGDDRSAARRLARDAAEQYRAGGAEKWADSIAVIESWLAEH